MGKITKKKCGKKHGLDLFSLLCIFIDTLLKISKNGLFFFKRSHLVQGPWAGLIFGHCHGVTYPYDVFFGIQNYHTKHFKSKSHKASQVINATIIWHHFLKNIHSLQPWKMKSLNPPTEAAPRSCALLQSRPEIARCDARHGEVFDHRKNLTRPWGLRCFFAFYRSKLPLNHHLGEYVLLFPSILSLKQIRVQSVFSPHQLGSPQKMVPKKFGLVSCFMTWVKETWQHLVVLWSFAFTSRGEMWKRQWCCFHVLERPSVVAWVHIKAVVW